MSGRTGLGEKQGSSDNAAFEAAYSAANSDLQANWACREDGRFETYDD
ncbi:MAG: hypothetical protein Q8N53_10480 [Longimicrobiales bacterium]|nr:hypothetical protein [Longimicrobiales bacterium]